MRLLVILFISKKMHLLGNVFVSPHASNRIYLLQNCSSNNIYLKDMYITLKGIGKSLFVSVLKMLLKCKWLNFAAVFTKKRLNFPKFAFNFPCEKNHFSLINRTHRSPLKMMKNVFYFTLKALFVLKIFKFLS